MDPLQPNSKIIFCHHGTKTPNKKRNSDLQNKRNQPFLKMLQSSPKLILVVANAKGQRTKILPIRALFSLFTS